MRDLFSFPNPVNEKAARTVATGVVLFSLIGLLTGWNWLLAPMAVGFWLRVAAGPRFSPLGQIATKWAAPRLGAPVMVPGPHKRFAQTVGAVTTTAGLILAVGFGVAAAGTIVFAIMMVFATLEAAFRFCFGCTVFAALIRIGLIPDEVCEACADISLRRA